MIAALRNQIAGVAGERALAFVENGAQGAQINAVLWPSLWVMRKQLERDEVAGERHGNGVPLADVEVLCVADDLGFDS